MPPQNAEFDRRQRTKRNRRFFAASLLLCSLAILHANPSQAQQSNNNPINVSDLAYQNSRQVAASAVDIKSVLVKDPGLMVELKRWVAKDSTEHGQIVGSTELSDYAIFDRLESDVEFRSVATALLQRYGYLVPKVNPESDLAKDQDLLRVERTKWLAQAEEEQRVQARQKEAEDFKKARECDASPQDAKCNGEHAGAPPSQAPGTPPQNQQYPAGYPQFGYPQQGFPQNEQLMPNIPLIPGTLSPPQQLIQTGISPNDSSSPFSLSLLSAQGANSSSNGSGMSALGGFSGLSQGADGAGMNRQLGAATGSGNFGGLGAPTDGLLSAYGMGMSGGSGGLGMGMTPDLTSMLMSSGSGSAGGFSPLPNASPLVPMQPFRKFPEKSSNEPADMVRRANPYQDVPSLYDMYVQTVARPSTPQRFGTEVFENGAHDLQLIPMDLPAGPDYVVGPGDGLSIDLWGAVSQRLTRTVDRGGQISLPEVGPVNVSGKSISDVQELLQQVLRTQFRNVSLGVSLARLRTIRVYEVGDVTNPGAYDISSLSTPLNALFVAGGPSTRGSLRILKHYRGNQLIQTVDVYDLLLHGVKTNIERLENGDTVQVPPIGPQVTIEGMVRRPAIYELRDEKNLSNVIELAGGLLPTASLRHIEVQRLVAHDKQTMLSVDVPEGADNPEITRTLESFEIQDGDRIRIYPIAPYNQDTIFVEGHVSRPGRYSFHSGMRVTDILSSYKDILPEPALQYAEIIRLNPPDYRPSVESFSLTQALADPSKAPALQSMDTIRVFSRFDFEDPPTVSVMGDVRAPGAYRTSGQVRLADAVHLAGGLTRDAEMGDAQVFRYLPDGKFRIFSVDLKLALAGDEVDNILLEPRDRLLVHKNPDAAEQATVYIEGQVGNPGRYPLTTNMHVADLIHVGGGLKPSADPNSADLTKFEWTNQSKLGTEQQEITISAALAGDPNANVVLHNGDVLTIRERAGWEDLGAHISLKGEVKRPGVYGIRPGERLSSVIERAGGFLPGAYTYGAIFQRTTVRELQEKDQETMILRIKSMESGIEQIPDTDPKQKQIKQNALAQYQSLLDELSANPPIGRVSIRISTDVSRWKGTAADIEVRAGDSLIIPKRPSYVLVAGQVFNPTALGYRPGRSAAWYLSQAGGPTQIGDKKAIFVIRADGSVMGVKKSMFSGESLNGVLQPGDAVVVPERAIAGPVQWQNIFSGAQVAGTIATMVYLAMHY